jgi:hypothetical protein
MKQFARQHFESEILESHDNNLKLRISKDRSLGAIFRYSIHTINTRNVLVICLINVDMIG